MLVFPQLSTGTVAMYPLRRTVRRRTVQNVMADGSSVVYGDPDFGVKQWDLEAVGLSDGERAVLMEFFESAGGQASTFTFLEPAGNLLAQSETFDADEWDNSPLASVAAGIDDPWGGTRASRVTNGGPAGGLIAQVLAVPGTFQYVLSAWVRADTVSGLTLFGDAAGGSAEKTVALTGDWTRVSMPVTLGLTTESVRFGVSVEAAKTVDLVGMQVEAQPGAGDYQRTGRTGGVHSKARFGIDELVMRARGTDVYDAVIRIVSKGN